MKPDIERFFYDHNNIASGDEIRGAGFGQKHFQSLVREGKIKRIASGLFSSVYGEEPDEANLISALFPDGYLCMDTAFFHYGYSNRTPAEWHITVSKDSSKSRFQIHYPFVKPYYIEPKYLEIGATEDKIHALTMKIYDRERIICDCLRFANKMDREMFNSVIQSYVADNKKNIRTLIEYSKELRVYTKMQTWIGVWL